MSARLILALAAPFAIAAQNVPPQPEKPTAGVLCAWALTSWFYEIAHRCTPRAAPDVEAALLDSRTRYEAFVRAEANRTDADIVAFRAEQGGAKMADAELCGSDDAAHVQKSLGAEITAQMIRTETDKLLRAARTVEWGTCV